MAKTFSAVLVGVECHIIEIEAVVASGFSGINILGLSGDVIRDLRERVRSALESADFVLPARRIVVNLTPSQSLKLCRTPFEALDFAVAAAVVRAIDEERSQEKGRQRDLPEYFFGELSLSGELRPLAKPSPIESLASKIGSAGFVSLPEGSPEVNSFAVAASGFRSFSAWCSQRLELPFVQIQSSESDRELVPDVEADAWQFERVAKVLTFYPRPSRSLVALLVAAAGRHNLLLAGEPGVGKSFLAHRLMELQPPLMHFEKAEVSLIQSGENGVAMGDEKERPFRTPHHTATAAALIGGATLRPGEVTLAHRGLLFLDELAEFNRGALEALREPIDNGRVVLSRAGGAVEFPAHFHLCAATNPCPCGFLLSRRRSCRCSPTVVRKYHLKLSGPMLDRFALQVWLGDESEEGLFVQALNNVLQSEGVDGLVRRFLRVQGALYHLSEEQKSGLLSREQLQPLQIAVSRRGEKHMRLLSLTFRRLFPEVDWEPNAWLEVARYRSLESKLGEAVRFT